MCKVRVPTGRFVLELPAGMLDDDKGDFVGTAVREVCLASSLSLSYTCSRKLVVISSLCTMNHHHLFVFLLGILPNYLCV